MQSRLSEGGKESTGRPSIGGGSPGDRRGLEALPRAGIRHGALASLSFLAAGSLLGGGAQAQTAPQKEELFHYKFRKDDTLIHLSNRLLKAPGDWQKVQTLNKIGNVFKIPIGTTILIPYSWLKVTVESATVTAVSGVVTREGRLLKVGDLLRPGDAVETGPDGSITLTLPDRSTITLLKATSLQIEALEQIVGDPDSHRILMQLRKGRVESHVQHQGDAGGYVIQTPVAMTAVRGTVFRVSFDGISNRAGDETLEGIVGVNGQVGAEVPVGAGLGTVVAANAAPLVPVPLLPPPDLTGIAPNTSGAQLTLAWPAVAGAVRYRVQTAPDPGFQSFYSDTETAGPPVTVPAPPTGNYYLRVHSIDALGLEGTDATRALLQRAAIPTPVSPAPGGRVSGTQTAFAWRGETLGVHYRWQLSSNGDFSQPLQQRDVTDANTLQIEGLPAGSYQWRVALLDAQGVPGEWSTPASFVEGPAGPVPEVHLLKHQAVELRWEGDAHTRYRVQVARDAAFRQVVLDQTVEGSQLIVPSLRMGRYHVRVQTADAPPEVFGETKSFDVSLPLWLRIAIPVAIVVGLALT